VGGLDMGDQVRTLFMTGTEAIQADKQ
jgi:hypothetical protein